jgi:hypothetical protein
MDPLVFHTFTIQICYTFVIFSDSMCFCVIVKFRWLLRVIILYESYNVVVFNYTTWIRNVLLITLYILHVFLTFLKLKFKCFKIENITSMFHNI